MERDAILGISVNTRVTGIALLSGNCLVDYFTKLNKTKWSPTKAQEMITSLYPCYPNYYIKTVCLAIPYAYQIHPELVLWIEQIKAYFKEKQVPVRLYAQHHLRFFYQEKKTKKTQEALMEALVTIYPELLIYYQKERVSRTHYFIKMFEAVGVAKLESMKK